MSGFRQFGVGQKVRVTENVDLQPYTTLVAGETGTVRGAIDEMGIQGVEVHLDTRHKALCAFDNIVLLTEPELSKLSIIARKIGKAAAALFLSGGFLATASAVKAHAVTVSALILTGGLSGLF